MDDVAIKVNNISKNFHYTSGRAGTIKSAFTNVFKSKESKNKDIQHALKDISFEIKKGEFYGIVGRNGSGKSTLLKMIAGIYQPNSGTIEVQGKLVPFIELGVGFNPELTGRENVYLNGALLGFTRKEVEAQYQEIVEFAELEKFMDQQLKNYSSGMQVRLAFAMAVRAKADILLIDEVLAVGDADFQRKCFEYFKQLKQKKITVVFISHDMNAVSEYCDRAMLVDKNEVIDIGPTNEITQKYLRLFMDNNFKQDGAKTNQDRWGDQSIIIKNVTAKSSEGKIKIVVNVGAMQDFDHPNIGFRLRDEEGKEVTGTNTRLEGIVIPILKKGESTKVTWTFPAVLRDGKYSVDIALQYPDEITVADWWNSAATFVLKKSRRLPYILDPDFITVVD
jgi:ABC-2 type transport system ATP-binding protein